MGRKAQVRSVGIDFCNECILGQSRNRRLQWISRIEILRIRNTGDIGVSRRIYRNTATRILSAAAEISRINYCRATRIDLRHECVKFPAAIDRLERRKYIEVA